MEIERLFGTPSDRLDAVGSQRFYFLVHKLAGLTLLVLLSPVMIVSAVAIWLSDGAPLFFAHYRVGAEGRLFRCLKFRTMRVDSQQRLAELLNSDSVARDEWERDRKLTNDPRITPIGRLLRKTSLDELPQLLNVVKGEMALVGPRPITVQELQRYGGTRWHYLSVVPGMTGLWQVSGRNNTTYEERVDLDRRYVENRSLWNDMKILVRTVLVVVTGHGAR